MHLTTRLLFLSTKASLEYNLIYNVLERVDSSKHKTTCQMTLTVKYIYFYVYFNFATTVRKQAIISDTIKKIVNHSFLRLYKVIFSTVMSVKCFESG